MEAFSRGKFLCNVDGAAKGKMGPTDIDGLLRNVLSEIHIAFLGQLGPKIPTKLEKDWESLTIFKGRVGWGK